MKMNEYDSAVIAKIYFYATITIVPIGLTFNALKFYLFCSSQFSKLNFGFLMRILAVFESITLFWNIFIFRYLPLNGFDIPNYSNVTCALMLYSARVLQLIPLLIQAFISFINYLSVTDPSRLHFFNRKWCLVSCITMIVVICGILNLPSGFRYLDNIVENNQTNLVCTATVPMSVISSILTAFLRSVLPFLLINITNVFTVRALMRPRELLNISTQNERKFAKTLVYLGIIFFVFNFPLSCAQVVMVVYQFLNSAVRTSSMTVLGMVLEITRLIGWSYFAIGFFINFTFNKLFRKVFIKRLKTLAFKFGLVKLKTSPRLETNSRF